MPTAVIMPQSRANNGDDLLQTAIGLARDVYKVRMDDKQLAKAQELAAQKEANNISEADRKESLAFAKDFEVVKPDVAGAIDPRAAGLALPRGLQLPEGMAIRPRSISENEAKLAFEKQKHAADIASKAGNSNDQKFSKITGQTAETIGNLTTVADSIKQLSKDWDSLASGFGSSLTQFGAGSDANQYNKKMDVAIQNIGYALEGGKMTDGDRAYYREMMPKPTDTVDQKNAKITALKEYAQRKFKGTVNALRQTGFDVANIQEPDFGLDENDKEDIVARAIAEKQRRQQMGTAQNK